MTSATNLNFLKGRMAEHLVQDLFVNCNYNVFNYGLERIHPFLSKSLVKNYKNTSKALRFMPDFVVQSTLNGDLFYMEVKFRADGCFKFDDRYVNYPYKNAWFVIVSPNKIQCMHYKRLIAGYNISPGTSYTFSQVKSFHIDKEMLATYEEYAKQVFAGFSKKVKQ